MIENSTRIQSINYEIEYRTKLLIRTLEGLGTDKETPKQWEDVELLVASVLAGKRKREELQKG